MRPSAPRRRRFAQELHHKARTWGDRLSQTYEFAFRRRYGLPPTDPRFLNATVEEIMVDFHAHRFWDDPKLREQEVVSEGFEDMLAAMEAENAKRLAQPPVSQIAASPDAAKGDTPLPPPLPVPAELQAIPAEDWETVEETRFDGS